MMPLLFAVGQHHALDTVSRSLREDEKLLAYLDDIYFCCEPDRVGEVYTVVQEALQTHAGISVHGGKTKVWNMAGERPPVCDVLNRSRESLTQQPGFGGVQGASGQKQRRSMLECTTPTFGSVSVASSSLSPALVRAHVTSPHCHSSSGVWGFAVPSAPELPHIGRAGRLHAHDQRAASHGGGVVCFVVGRSP